jgi:MutS domain V
MQKVKNFFIDSTHKEERDVVSASFNRSHFDTAFIRNIVEPPNNASFAGNAIIGDDVHDDVEMFTTYKGNGPSVHDELIKDNQHLKGTIIYTESIMRHPTACVDTLSKRQSILKDVERSIHSLNAQLATLTDVEDEVLWFFEKKEENIRTLYDIVYLRSWFLERFNHSAAGTGLTAYNVYRILVSPAIGILSPIVYFVLPYLVLRHKMGLKISFATYLKLLFQSSKWLFEMKGLSGKLRYCSYLFSLVFYFQGVFNSVEMSKTIHSVSSFILDKTHHILEFIKVSNDVVGGCVTPYVESCFWNITRAPRSTPSEPMRSRTPSKWWLFSNFGTYLSAFKRFDKDELVDLLSKVYMTDALVSIVNCRLAHGLSYTKYTTNVNTPRMSVKGVWHPCISTCVRNDLRIGQGRSGGSTRNMILTGPNAGGKSTLVKAVLLNTLLCQTVGLSCSVRCKMTPYHFINSQINIPDCKGKESLFQAEMNRCKMNFDVIGTLKQNEFALVLMDEVFNSTNPVEGISGAYAVASKLGNTPNVSIMFTTHYTYLTKLGHGKGDFINYRMNVVKCGSGYEFPYKIERGVSKQYIAIELLELNGFRKDLIDEAKRVRDAICV